MGGEEHRDEGHTCHSSPNGDASLETQLASNFDSSRVIVSSQPRVAQRLAMAVSPGYIYTSLMHTSIGEPLFSWRRRFESREEGLRATTVRRCFHPRFVMKVFLFFLKD